MPDLPPGVAASIPKLPDEEMRESERQRKRMVGIVRQTEKWYEDFWAWEDVRNTSYYRGRFWVGDGLSSPYRDLRAYRAQINETFPIVDTMVSALVMRLPQVELDDQRARTGEVPTVEDDTAIQGRRLASVLNVLAHEDDLDETVRELVGHGMLFRMAPWKCSWAKRKQGLVWRTKLPWECHFDPMAKRLADVGWVFERFSLHIEDLRKRMRNGLYQKAAIKPDSYPRSLIDLADRDVDSRTEQLKKLGLLEYVAIVEFWDLRKGKLYHIHMGTHTVLMEVDLPFSRPYGALVFNKGVGRLEGVSAVSLIAEQQRDINELSSARREVVSRLPRRMLADKGLWKSDADASKWLKSRTWQPSLVNKPSGSKSLAEHFFVTPSMDTTFDFNRHFEEQLESIRRVVGEPAYQRGQALNVRTAEEMSAIRGAAESRVSVRMNVVEKTVMQMFQTGLEVLRWAVLNPAASGIDLEALARSSQVDTDAQTLARDILEARPKFKLQPFSPLMEDRYARRRGMTEMMQARPDLAAAVSQEYDPRELAKEEVELHGWRPSVLRQPGEAQAQPAPPQEVPAEEPAMAAPIPLPLPPNRGQMGGG